MTRLKSVLTTGIVLTLVLTAAVAAQIDTGSADFSRYASIGDSLTAGFISGGLTQSSQKNSYPFLIHRQATGLGGFEQPLVSDPGLPPILTLQMLVPPIIVPKPGVGVPLNINLPRPYDNMAVPGADVADVLRTVTDFGGLHDLILRGLGTQLQQALSLQPTFVSLWVGNNDALGAATSGIVIDGVTLTRLADFEADFRAIVNSITGTGAQLVMANIPGVTTIPFVSTIDPFIVIPGGATVPILGPNGPLGLDDNVLITAGGLLAVGIGVPIELGGTGLPLPDEVVLDASETARVTARVNGFNSVISTVAGEVGAPLVDASGLFNEIVQNGLVVGGVEYTADFLTGGMFSYDGVHPSSFGYAFIANEFIKAVNSGYDAAIPLVDLFPFVFGEAGRAPQLAAAQGAIFSDRAFENLQYALGQTGTKGTLDGTDADDDSGAAGAPTVAPVGEPTAGPGEPGGKGPGGRPVIELTHGERRGRFGLEPLDVGKRERFF